MSKRVIVVHGWEGTPEKDWLPWLKNELEKKGFEVSVPTMPNTDEPKIETWVLHLKEQIGKPDKNTFLVGHSLGCQSILRYLEGLPKHSVVGGVILVAGFLNLNNLSKEEQIIIKPWLTKKINLEKASSHTDKISAIFSDNDTWVPLSDSEIFKKRLEAKVIVMKNKGHFSGDEGIFKLPIVLEEILDFMEY